MSHDAYIARAAALQVAAVIQAGGHFFCEQLPRMDVERFLTALGEETGDATAVSLALVGYGLSDTDLRDRLNSLGFAVGHVTTDLHVAARWRNEPHDHPNIIAIATGRHPGVSTLAHFPQGDARVFARELLQWARKAQAGLVSTPPQETLLQVLAENSGLSPLVSLSGIAGFLATWEEARTDNELDAPRRALPRLGILPDRNLLSVPNGIADRLLKNFNLTQEIAKMTGSRLLLLRLFQHTPICSGGVCPAQPFPRVSASFSANSPPKTPANSIWRRAVGRTDSCVSAVGAGTRMCSSTGTGGNARVAGIRSR